MRKKIIIAYFNFNIFISSLQNQYPTNDCNKYTFEAIVCKSAL